MALLGTVFSYGIYFWWYRFLKNKFSLYLKRSKFSNREMMLITALAGSIGSIFSNPIWMLNTRLVTSKKDGQNHSLTSLIRSIIKNEGVSAFFKGVVPNLILVINPIINFVVYERLKKLAIKRFGSERKISFKAIFIMSSIGKILATFATYPILTVRVKLQADTSKQESSTSSQITKLIRDIGVSGLYFGIEAKLI